MISRREFVAGSLALALASRASGKLVPESEPVLVNDIHSQLNATRVLEILEPRSREDVQSIVRAARKNRKIISIAGGRHAMGGQQFGTDTVLIDIRKLNQVLHLDRERGVLAVESGIEWPELIGQYLNFAKWGSAAMGHRAETNRRRSADDGRNHGRECAWAWPEAEAVYWQR
jgi:hypothetical protein